MCGIVGYVGKKNATPILLKGLEALEYRGYDSAGIYVGGRGTIKRAGNVATLVGVVPSDFSGTCGIAHTRWATHGVPNEVNAHPHSDTHGSIAIVHNGIIENFAELRKELTNAGVIFASDTDTEVLAQIIGSYHNDGASLESAVQKALGRVRGTYGIAVGSEKEPEKIVVARMGSPLMLGIGTDGYYVASDATPILEHTRKVIYLDDGEMCIMTPEGFKVTNLSASAIEKQIETLDWDVEATQKQGYEHFMLKEIMEMPEVIENTIRGRLDEKTGSIRLGGLKDVKKRLSRARRIIITACGTAYYAGLVGKALIEELVGIPVEVEVASEFRYRKFTANPDDTVLIAVSQSGETADTLGAVRLAKENGMLALGVINVVGSTIARETDAGVYNHAGPEIGVASTKAFVSQMIVLALIALLLKEQREGQKSKEAQALVKELRALPAKARLILSKANDIKTVAEKYKDMRDALFIGRKFQFPIAYEGALKLKELSYLHAEAYGAGEMKHGPLALIDQNFPSIVLMPLDSVYEKTRSNMEEIRGRGGPIIAVTSEDAPKLEGVADTLFVPKSEEALYPVLTVIPLHLFAYYVAHARGLPIDKPRNLAKSLTVE
jgi:glucosamine--fructose-6-phosphate aminotransferase (isomerizing)